MQTRPTVHLARLARAVMVELQHVARVHDEGLFQAREAQVLGQPRMLGKLPELAVDRHEVPRPHQVQHQLHLLHAAVSGDVQRRIHAAVHARRRRAATCGRSCGKSPSRSRE